MFFFNNECLLITCNRSWPTACDAVPNKHQRFADAYYLRVRNAGTWTFWACCISLHCILICHIQCWRCWKRKWFSKESTRYGDQDSCLPDDSL